MHGLVYFSITHLSVLYIYTYTYQYVYTCLFQQQLVICDTLTGEKFKIRSKSVILCAGPFTDELRKMENGVAGSGDNMSSSSFKPAVTGASGIHIGPYL